MINSIITAANFIRHTFIADDDYAIPAMLDACIDYRADDHELTLADSIALIADFMINDINDAHDATIDIPDADADLLHSYIRDADTAFALALALSAMLTIDLLTYYPNADIDSLPAPH